MISWWRKKREPVLYRGIGLSRIKGNTRVRTAEQAEQVIGMMQGTIAVPRSER